jgi:hypothetical protein
VAQGDHTAAAMSRDWLPWPRLARRVAEREVSEVRAEMEQAALYQGVMLARREGRDRQRAFAAGHLDVKGRP